MSSEWRKIQLGKVASTLNGAGIKQSHFAETGVPLARVSNFVSSTIDLSDCIYVETEHAKRWQKHRLNEGDVIVATVGSWPPNWSSVVGKVVRVPASATGALQNQNTCRIIANKELADQQFLFYLLNTSEFIHFAANTAAGSANQARLSVSSLEKFSFSLPPLIEQGRIASILGALDNRITLLRETNKTLESIAQTMFKSWFVDFDPVRAKMEGRQPEGMDEEMAVLFPDSFEESKLGLIPKGWTSSTVGETFDLTMGQSPPSDTYNTTGEGLPFYQGRTDFGFRFPSKRVFCTSPTRLALDGDTLISVRAPVGDVNMAIGDCSIGRGVAAARHPLGYKGFTFYTMRQLGSEFKTYDSEGTVFGSINKKDFQALRVVAPGMDVLRIFDETTAPLDSRIENNEGAIRTLTSLRDSILPRLISGQLRLPEAQEQVEKALP